MNNLKILPITENNYADVCFLYNNELNIKISQSRFEERVRCILKSKEHDIFVAVCDGNVIAFIAVEKARAIECDYLKINGIAVKESYQGRGIGSQLIDFAEHYAKEHNIDLIILNSAIQRTKAHIFYEKLGFEKKSYSFRKKI